MRRSLVVALEAAASVAAVLILAAGLLFWRLSAEPLELSFLTPYLETALSSDDGPRVRIEHTSLGFAHGAGTANLVLTGVRVSGRDGRLLAAIPEIALSLGVRPALHGILAPTQIVLYRPHLHVVRESDGSFSFGVDTDDASGRDVTIDMLRGLLAPRPGDEPLSHLARAAILDAVLTLDDRRSGIVWHAPRAAFSVRRTATGLVGDADLTLRFGSEQSDLHVDLAYPNAEQRLDGKLTLVDWNPAALADADPALAPLAALDAPVGGTIAFAVDASSMRLEGARVDLSAGAGRIRHTEFPGGGVPVTGIEVQAAYDGTRGQVSLENFRADLGGPQFGARGTVDGLFLDPPARPGGAGISASFDLTARQMPANDLERYWPTSLGPAARAWVTRNIRDGTVEDASATARLHWSEDAGKPILDAISGRMRAVDATVYYLRPLPPVRGAKAAITFDRATMDISPTAGTLRGVRVTGGTLHLFNLDTNDEQIDIDLALSGPLRDALDVLDTKPFEYAKEIGVDPARVKGSVEARLSFKFPLKRDLKFDQVELGVRSQLTDVAIEKMLFHQDLSGGTFALQVDRNGLKLEGGAKLAGMPAGITAFHFFKPKDTVRTRYTAWVRLDEEGRRRLDLDFLDGRVHGPVGVNVTLTQSTTKRGDATIVLDLQQAGLDLAELNFAKPPGVPGQARLELELDDDRPTRIRDAVITAPSLDARGSLTFSGQPAQVQRVDISRLVAGETDLTGTVQRRAEGGWQVRLQGLALDATRLLDDAGGGNDRRQPPLVLEARLDRLVLGERREVRNLVARLDSDGLHWQTARAEASLIGGGTLAFRLGVAGGERNFTLSTDNMGAALRFIDITDHISGGQLRITGRAEDIGPRRIYRGRLNGSDYRVLNAPAFAKLLSVASFSAIASLLSGEGIPFTRLVGGYVLDGGRIELKGARAYGGAIGINASGSVDTDRKTLDLQGTLVPAYSINSILGNIPVLGNLLLGGKGQGLFAANFHLAGGFDDPKISVNPLSALAPGFLRNLFLFDAPDPTQPVPEPPPKIDP